MAVIFNLLAIFSITFVVANIALSAFFALVNQRLLTLEVKSRKLLLWFIVLFPWLMSTIIAYLMFQTNHSDSLLSEFGFPHWHHMTEFEWYSWHGITVVFAVSFFLYTLFIKTKQLLSHRRQIASLIQLAIDKGNGIYQLELDEASAFTTGFLSKKCFVTSGLLEKTTNEEQDVIIRHEKAHIETNDPFKKWAFFLLSQFFIPSIAERLKLHMILAMEQAADNAVINGGTSKIFVASTLVKVAKLNARSAVLKGNELVVNFGADVLEQRVYFLLGKLKLMPINKAITTTLVIVLVLISATSIDGIHHFMETVFSH